MFDGLSVAPIQQISGERYARGYRKPCEVAIEPPWLFSTREMLPTVAFQNLPDNKVEVNARSNNGDTPLHVAANEGHKDVAELLLANNADVKAKSNGGYTPLYFAAFNGSEDVAELLLANHADVNAMDTKGETPLPLVALKGHKDVVELLRHHGGHE